MAAGSGKNGTPNETYYLYRSGFFYWSISPGSIHGGANVYFVYLDGGVSSGHVDGIYGGGIAPVINLSAEYVKTLRGTGTMTDPYQA